MTKPYTPRGYIVPLIQAAKADPQRIFTVSEAVKLMGVKSRKVGGSLTYALRAGMIFRGKVNGLTAYKGSPFADGGMPPPPVPQKIARIKPASGWETDPDDPRVPKVVPGWTPPKMVCVRQAAA